MGMPVGHFPVTGDGQFSCPTRAARGAETEQASLLAMSHTSRQSSFHAQADISSPPKQGTVIARGRRLQAAGLSGRRLSAGPASLLMPRCPCGLLAKRLSLLAMSLGSGRSLTAPREPLRGHRRRPARYCLHPWLPNQFCLGRQPNILDCIIDPLHHLWWACRNSPPPPDLVDGDDSPPECVIMQRSPPVTPTRQPQKGLRNSARGRSFARNTERSRLKWSIKAITMLAFATPLHLVFRCPPSDASLFSAPPVCVSLIRR